MKVWALFVAASALAVAPWAVGQKPAPPAQPAPQSDEPTRITVDVTRVNFLYTVKDKKARFVTGLTKDDFEVIENKRPQTVLEFAAETDLPLRLAVLIDTSGSVRERFRFEQDAASEFINTVMHPRIDKAMVVSFDTEAELRSELVDNPDTANAAIRDLRAGGGTAMYDAIYFACRDKLSQDQPMHKFRRAMVIVSDGDDNYSRYTRDQALERAQKDEVVIYTISTNISRDESEGDRVLKYFAKETGGRAFFPFKVEDMAQSFVDIANELRHQYNLSYRPEPLATDGLFHPVELRVKGRKDLMVLARPGYFAPKM
ncbi:MAG: VWA domain-containing protein [Bryobacteraceae bacterium]|jgi:VWFA-related protein